MMKYLTVQKIKVDKTADLVKGLVVSIYFTRVSITSMSTKFPLFYEGGNHITFYGVRLVFLV